MTDVNDGNFYLSRARCNRQTVSLEPRSATEYSGTVNVNGKITQVVLMYHGALPLQSGTGTGSFVIKSDIIGPAGKIPYHVPLDNFPTSINPSTAVRVMDVTPGSDTQERSIFPTFYNTTGDGAGQPVLLTEGGNIAIGKTSWNGLVAGEVEFTFTLSGSSPIGAEKALKVTIYLE